MKRYIIIICALVLSMTAKAQTGDNLWQEANSAYAESDYTKAIELYSDILNMGLESSDLYYNLGNAYFKSDSLAKAIVNYHRALKLDPSNENLIHNLEVAEAQTLNRIESVPPFFLVEWVHGLKYRLSSNGWAIAAQISFFLMLAFIAFYLLSGNAAKRKFGFTLASIMAILFVISLVSSNSLRSEKVDSKGAIIIKSAISVKSSPDRNGKDLFILNEGASVEVRDSMNGYSEIVIASGNSGWVPTESVEII